MPGVMETRPDSHWHAPDRIKACITCGEVKPLSEFQSYRYTTNQGKRSRRYESRCKSCARERRVERYNANRDIESQQTKEWRQQNAEHYHACQKEYRSKPEKKALRARLQRLRKARARADMLGPEDRERVREIYAEAMRLQGIFGVPVHVDHIIPLSRGGKHEPDNLQILLAKENLRKGVKCPK